MFHLYFLCMGTCNDKAIASIEAFRKSPTEGRRTQSILTYLTSLCRPCLSITVQCLVYSSSCDGRMLSSAAHLLCSTESCPSRFRLSKTAHCFTAKRNCISTHFVLRT